MSKPVIYMVTQKQENGKPSFRVVKAATRHQAIGHVVESTIECRPMSPLEVESWMEQGKKIERAKSIPAPVVVTLTSEQAKELVDAASQPGGRIEVVTGGLPAGDRE